MFSLYISVYFVNHQQSLQEEPIKVIGVKQSMSMIHIAAVTIVSHVFGFTWLW